jgi:hypothetical protein
VQRWHLILLAGIVVIGGGYGWTHRQQLGLTGAQEIGANDSPDVSAVPTASIVRPTAILWQKVDRSADGFRLEMPADVKQIQIPAYNESGGTDQVNMLFSNPDAETQFSVAWADKPPVARVSKMSANRTLEMARNGAIARTQTTEVSESVINTQGFPGREFSSRNNGGGVMNSRLLYAGSRLYMLTAVYPSAAARREKDLRRFFNSFVITSSPASGKAEPQVASKTD